MAPGVHTGALQRAAQILGGKEKLRAELHVPMRELERWLEGEAAPPTRVFLKAVDIISGVSGLAPAAPLHEARDRGIETRAAIFAGRRVHAGEHSRSVLDFLTASYRPDEGADMIAAALECALAGSGADMGNVQLVCPEGLRIVAQRGFERPFLDFFALVGHEGSACGVALKQGQRIVVPNVPADPIFARTAAEPVMAQARARAVQSTPIMASSGWVLGVLSTHYERPYAPSPRELEAVERIARRAAFWLEGGAA